MEKSLPEISSIVVTQVYTDFGFGLDKRTGKFVVVFDYNWGRIDHKSIAHIKVHGPRNYHLDILPHKRFNSFSLNGYVDDQYYDRLWYMAFDFKGFLKDGEYVIEVTFANGTVKERSRVLQYDDRILKAYLDSRKSIKMGPTGFFKVDRRSHNIPLSWTTLRELTGLDAFYCTRLSKEISWPNVDVHRLLFFDDIFAASETDPSYGLNKSSATVEGKAVSFSAYTWFTEILDSNRFENINIAIFQPAKWIIAV